MAGEEFNAVYVGSDDYWGHDSDTFNEETQWFGKSWVVPGDEVTEELIRDEGLNRCALYYEVGRADSHLFTPTSIGFDEGTGFLLINGTQGRIGEPGATVARRRAYSLGKISQRYKNMMAGAKSNEPGRFTVNYIDASNEPDKQDIINFIESLEEEPVAAAEEFDAETLNRINPQYVEGAEDIFGAEGGHTNDIFHVVLHSEDSALEVHTLNGGTFLADIDSGMILHDSSEFAAEDAEPLGAEDVGFLLSLSAEGDGAYSFDAEAESFNSEATPEEANQDFMEEWHDAEQVIPQASAGPSQDESNQDYMEDWSGDAEDIIEVFQEFPVLRRFRLNGWLASAVVVGIAGLTGAYISRRS